MVSYLRIALLIWLQANLLGPDLFKMPLLLAHYYEHLEENSDLGFNAFLALHYADPAHEEADHTGHENLPFHHHHGAAVDNGVVKVWTSDPIPAVSFPELIAVRQVGLIADDAELAGHARGLLRPPRSLG
ncbi:MAG TPA: hypothetical protein PLB89_16085 [Flavobacteriales bacterium]|nr:hypothetical protein [Flavobacteriales bacterium]